MTRYELGILWAARVFSVVLLLFAVHAAARPTPDQANRLYAGQEGPSGVPYELDLSEWEALVWSHVDRGEPARAARAADVRLALAPDDVEWRRSWIQVVHGAPGRSDEALAAARQLVAVRPGDADARRLLARLLSWGDGQDEAMAIYDALIAGDPGDVESLKARAEMARWNHDPLKAQRLLEQAAASAGEDEEIATRLEAVGPEAARMRAARTDPTLPLLLGVIVVPILLGFGSRTVTTGTWGVLILWVATLLWAVSHLVGTE